MSSTNQNTTTTKQQQQQQQQGKGDRRGKRTSNSSRPTTYNQTRRYKAIPMDRDSLAKGAPPLVKGSKGAFLARIHKVSGCNCRFLSPSEQHNFKAIEINTGDARILEITIDPEVNIPNSSNQKRLNKACQMVAGAIMHWRDIAFPPPDQEDEDEDENEDEVEELEQVEPTN